MFQSIRKSSSSFFKKKLAMKILKRLQLRFSAVYIANFEQISHIVLMFPLLTLIKFIQIVLQNLSTAT